jgi:hypothetical protein
MADLSALRAAKQALDEQLITQQDFDCVKVPAGAALVDILTFPCIVYRLDTTA